MTTTHQEAFIYCYSNNHAYSYKVEEQEKRVRAYAQEHHYKVTQVFSDSDQYEDWQDRRSLNKLLDVLNNRSDKTIVIIDKPSRLSRRSDTYLLIRDAIRDAGGVLQCSEFSLDDSAKGQFIENMILIRKKYELELLEQEAESNSNEA